MIGLGKQWRRREVAELLIKAAGDVVDEVGADPDHDADDAREWLAGWLRGLPGNAWDERLGPRPDGR